MMNVQYGQSLTPVAYPKFNSGLPSRKLWGEENNKPKFSENWIKHSNNENNLEIWDFIESPQFIDFSNLPDRGDSFFDRVAIVSTPIPNPKIKNNSTNTEDSNALISNLNNFSLADINHEIPQEVCQDQDERDETDNNEYIVHNTVIKVEQEIQQDNCGKIQKPQSTAVYPFSFDLREKNKVQHKRVNKVVEDEKKIKAFKARPVPKFIKARSTTTAKDPNANNIRTTTIPEKRVKKNTEVWKKPPFLPCLSQKNLERPKTPPLSTAIRAQQRKRFDDAIKEKERLREQIREMDTIIKKKQEEEEIARLRKKTVHKAQPVRKYKTGLPQVEKRPLTDPISPISLKRRRRN